MRCYFVKDARIVAFKELPGLSCKEAVEIARTLFEESASSYDGVEVWSLTRSIYRLGKPGNLPVPRPPSPAIGDIFGLFKRAGQAPLGLPPVP